jgi:hypothetical protein
MDVQHDQQHGLDAQASRAADYKFELLGEIERHPGFVSLKNWQQEEFLRVVSQLAVGRDIVGGWRAISGLLEIGRRQTFARLALWRDAGLISESSGAKNEWGQKGRHTFRPGIWMLLPDHVSRERSDRMRRVAQTRPHSQPHSTRARARGGDTLALDKPHSQPHSEPHSTRCLRIGVVEELHDGGNSSPAELPQATPAELDQATRGVTWLEQQQGFKLFTGKGRELLIESLIENPQGVHKCFERASDEATSSPNGLLLRLLRDGEHRQQETRFCPLCRKETPELHDIGPELRAGGPFLLCASCAEDFLTNHDPNDDQLEPGARV